MSDADSGTANITPVGGNIFLDLGFPPDEAVALKAASDRKIWAQLAANAAAGKDNATAEEAPAIRQDERK
ncbi:hypothetical protein [Leeia oryzae]|uniref:hypothetical protein n=1 Tax=Leeia oryzae TaxID=356662 RepID=UPI001B7FCB00|nr:hypothetical protein [Leeia oryzae]